jgi:hypothetical protein
MIEMAASIVSIVAAAIAVLDGFLDSESRRQLFDISI